MRLLIFLSLLVTLFAFSTNQTIKSNLYIPAGEQFNLGGGQDFSYRIEAKNVGPSVELFLNNGSQLVSLGDLKTERCNRCRGSFRTINHN
ncbi:MAG: hypothetical protein R2850_09720 [Bacteroidia bacterium]